MTACGTVTVDASREWAGQGTRGRDEHERQAGVHAPSCVLERFSETGAASKQVPYHRTLTRRELADMNE